MEDYEVLKECEHIFLKENLGLPSKRDIYFTIDLTPGSMSCSKEPYRMSIFELTKLKMQIQEMLGKKYTQPNVS